MARWRQEFAKRIARTERKGSHFGEPHNRTDRLKLLNQKFEVGTDYWPEKQTFQKDENEKRARTSLKASINSKSNI